MTWQELCEQTKEDTRRDGNHFVHKYDSFYYTQRDRGCDVHENLEIFADELKSRLKDCRPTDFVQHTINEMLTEVGVER